MANPICSTDCTSVLPPARFPGCGGQGKYVKESEIARIFVGKANRTPFTNWLNPAEWVGLVDNTGTADTDQTLRVYEVIGDIPAGSPVTKVISRKRTLTITKNRTINFTIDVITQETYDGMRIYECGGTFPIWAETFGGIMLGGNRGILMTVDPNPVWGRGDATEEILVVGAWQSKFMPERGPSPIFEGETDGNDDIDTVAPVFTVQPTPQTTTVGGSFTLTATSTNADSYQWQRSLDSGSTWQNITGANAVAFTKTNAAVLYDQAQYRRADTNEAGTTNSNAVAVTVGSVTYDNNLIFAQSTSASAQGVNATVLTANANQGLNFDTVTPHVGSPVTMNIKENNVTQMTVSTFQEYVDSGNSFEYLDTAGNPHTHVWAAGTVNFTI